MSITELAIGACHLVGEGGPRELGLCITADVPLVIGIILVHAPVGPAVAESQCI